MKITFIATLLSLVLALPTLADVIFEADFETPTYVEGNLDGQDGWAPWLEPTAGLQVVTNDPTTPDGVQSVYNDFRAYYRAIDITGYTITKFSGLFKKNPEGASGFLDFKYDNVMAGIGMSGEECYLTINWDTYSLHDDDHTALGEWVYASFTVNWDTMYVVEMEFGPDEANAVIETGNLVDISGASIPTKITVGAWTDGSLEGSYYDDLKVEGIPIPEPGMLIALLAGIGLLLRRC